MFAVFRDKGDVCNIFALTPFFMINDFGVFFKD
jgi:hypothetical protein